MQYYTAKEAKAILLPQIKEFCKKYHAKVSVCVERDRIWCHIKESKLSFEAIYEYKTLIASNRCFNVQQHATSQDVKDAQLLIDGIENILRSLIKVIHEDSYGDYGSDYNYSAYVDYAFVTTYKQVSPVLVAAVDLGVLRKVTSKAVKSVSRSERRSEASRRF